MQESNRSELALRLHYGKRITQCGCSNADRRRHLAIALLYTANPQVGSLIQWPKLSHHLSCDRRCNTHNWSIGQNSRRA